MKKIIIILIYLCPLIINAQDTVNKGQCWEYELIELSEFGEKVKRNFFIKIGDLTTFESIDCFELIYSDNNSTKRIGYIYETAQNEVYVYNTLKLENALFLHDGWLITNNFKLKQNDSYGILDWDDEMNQFINNNLYYVSDIDSLIINNKIFERRHITIKEHTNKSIYQTVKGIGNSKYGIFLIPNLEIDGYPQYQFVACYDKDVCIFEAKDFNAEAITDAISQIYKEPTNNNYLYDLQGRKVKNPTKGLYIKDGKKVMVK